MGDCRADGVSLATTVGGYVLAMSSDRPSSEDIPGTFAGRVSSATTGPRHNKALLMAKLSLGTCRAISPGMRITKLNLLVLAQTFPTDARQVPARAPRTDAPHLRRCLVAGLIEVRGGFITLTDAGAKALGKAV